MVRKRAQAEKALSPPKEIPTDSRSSSSPEEAPRKRSKREHTEDEDKPIKNGDDQSSNETDSTAPDLLSNEYDDLPDPLLLSKELSEECKGFWETVTKDYHNFSNWTTLLQFVTDSEDNLEAACAAYNCFLKYYPYCYGYWKKFADIEKKNGRLEQARMIFERGVQAFPISVDLWVHYINFFIKQNKGKKDKINEIRALFKRAVNSAGMEFKSNKLWTAFIDWEESQSNLRSVTEIYDQLILTPTQQYIKNWQKFKAHLELYKPGEILPAKEFGKLMKEMDAFPPGMVIEEEDKTGEEEGEVTLMGEEEGLLKESYTEIRNRVLKDRELVFRQTAQEIVKRWRFEESIKRPYFHIKPLEKSQIKNWKDYLDYELKQGDHKRIVFLFERCMVVCALYDFFWEKYLDYVETKDPEQARTVFLRACTIHLNKKYKLHLRWAIFEERQNNQKLAADILRRIDVNFPGMILITQHRIGLARRMRDHKEMISVYEKAIESAEKIEEKIFFSIKFSHALVKFCNKKTQARDVLWSALQLGKKHKRIYLTLLDLETHYGTIEMEFVDKLFSAIRHDLSLDIDFRLSCAQKKVEFYEEYSNNIDEIVIIQDEFLAEQKKLEAKMKDDKDERHPYSRNQGQREIPVHENTHFSNHQQQHQQQSWFPPSEQTNYDWQQYAHYTQQYSNNRQ